MMLMAFILAATASHQDAEIPSSECEYDLAEMLELDFATFDQDLNGGWRPLAARGCDAEAAELIRAWRHEKRNHSEVLYWHEGQLRASLGQTDAAIALFKLTYKNPAGDADFGWNHYVAGSIAFLRKDSEGLDHALAELAQIPPPEDLSVTLQDGTTFEISWPPNYDVLQAFKTCWDRPYSEAYSTSECRDPDGEAAD